MMEAMKRTQSLDTAKIAAAISKGMRVESPQGTVTMVPRPDFGNNRCVDALFETYLHTVEKGQLKPVATVTIDDTIDYINKSGIFKAK